MEEQHSFDEFFRESLADYRETPPPAAWDTVARRLDDDDRRRRRGFLYWPWISLCILLLMSGAWWLYGRKNGDDNIAGNGKARPEQSAPLKPQGVPAGIAGNAAAPGPAPLAMPTPAAAENSRADIPSVAVPATRSATGARSGSTPVTAMHRRSGQPGTIAPDVNGIRAAGRMTRQRQASSLPQVPDRTPRKTSRNASHAFFPGVDVHGRRNAPQLPASAPQPVPIEPAAAGSHPGQRQTTGAVPSTRQTPVAALRTTPADQHRVSGAQGPQTSGMETRLSAGILAPAASMPVSPSAVPAIPGLQPVPGPDSRTGQAAGTLPPASGPRPAGIQPQLAVPVTAPARPVAPRSVPDPVILLASLEPFMHLFAGAPLPPVFNIYETGLLDPMNYYAPLEPAPAPVVVVPDPAAAPAMYPPDSNAQGPRQGMALSAFFGYERGIKTPPRNMFTVGVRAMWQLSRSFSIGLQPALLYGNVPRMNLSSDKAYQRSAVDVSRFVTRDYSPSVLGQIDTVNNYVIREAFDSIIVRGTYIKGSIWQLELPLILQFNPFGSAFRVYGAPTVYFGGGMKIRSNGATETYTIDRKDSIVQSARMTEDQIKNYFGKSSLESYSNYNANAHSFNALDVVRFGYQFGLGYERNRLNFDLSVRQQLSGYHRLSSELRQLYAAPVFRLSVGYNLIPRRSKTPISTNP